MKADRERIAIGVGRWLAGENKKKMREEGPGRKKSLRHAYTPPLYTFLPSFLPSFVGTIQPVAARLHKNDDSAFRSDLTPPHADGGQFAHVCVCFCLYLSLFLRMGCQSSIPPVERVERLLTETRNEK